MELGLHGKTAVVTGANKGIGREIARQLAEASVNVVIGSRNAGRGEAAAADLAAQGLEVAAELIKLALHLLDVAHALAPRSPNLSRTHVPVANSDKSSVAS